MIATSISRTGELPHPVAYPVPHDDEVARLRCGDNEAWESLLARYEAKLFSYLRYNVPTPEDAEDLLNEIFLAAYCSMPQLEGESAVIKWLYAIARHKVADFWRSTKLTDELPLTLAAHTSDPDFDLRQALAALPESVRQAMLLRYREGLSVAEVAEVMSRSYRAVESLLNRGRTQLRVALQDGPEFAIQARNAAGIPSLAVVA
jgi:RNA polymerase sigma-70 factor, ECF subfamily